MAAMGQRPLLVKPTQSLIVEGIRLRSLDAHLHHQRVLRVVNCYVIESEVGTWIEGAVAGDLARLQEAKKAQSACGSDHYVVHISEGLCPRHALAEVKLWG